MAKKQLNLTVALKDGVVIHIKNAERGLKCGCTCPACGEPLVAKKGKKMMHHFSHHAAHYCEYGYESSLHLAAKEILSHAKRMTLPAVYVSFPNSNREKEMVHGTMEIQIDRVELERRFGDVIPDVVIYAGGKQFFVEVYVTHCIDDEKLAKLKEADISTIEIDLSKKNGITSVEELEEILLSESEEKQWKYNSESKQYLDSLYKAADKKDISYLRRIAHVENCPIEIQCRSDQPYTLYQDCRNCQYCLSYNYDDGILCLGRRSILTANDLDFSEAELKKDSKMELESYVDFSFASGLCPRCGGKLFEGEGKHGSGWCCMNYPYCSFTASVDPSTGEIIMTG